MNLSRVVQEWWCHFEDANSGFKRIEHSFMFNHELAAAK